MGTKYLLNCRACESSFAPTFKGSLCSKCGGSLETGFDYDLARESFSKESLSRRPLSVWKYVELLPVSATTEIVTLGEGGTRLILADSLGKQVGLDRLYLKDESKNPTYSFKDRKATVAVTKAKEFQYCAVTSATAGNAGASIAAYAAKAGLSAYIFAFRNITRAKLSKLIAYGARVIIVDGTSWDVFKLTEEASERFGWYNLVAASRYNPYVKDGAKTEAIEVCEQLDWVPPNWLIIPVGGGGGLASCWKGLKELEALGFINDLPRLVGVQGANCAPVVEAFEKELPPEKVHRVANAHTVAHSIEDDYPPDGEQALMAIRESRGVAVGIEDEQMLDMQLAIAKKEGLFLEPASAATVVAAKLLRETGKVDKNDTVVAMCTGSGLNEPDALFETAPRPPTIKPDFAELQSVLASFRD